MHAPAHEPFSDLPDALVRDLLNAALPVAEEVRQRIQALRASAPSLRDAALMQGIVARKADLERPREPSVVGIDGSYQIHRLTSLDLCAAAAVAVEGTAKEATRFWPEPYHRMWTRGVAHRVETTGVLRALMIAMEVELARLAPHDLVLLDGSFASLIIYANQGLVSLRGAPQEIGTELVRRWRDDDVFESVLALLGSDRVVALPKFTSRNELLQRAGLQTQQEIDGKTLATVILQPGEYTRPLEVYFDDQGAPETYHLPDAYVEKPLQDRMNALLAETRVVYFRPFGWVPALRLEVPGAVANSDHRLAVALEGVESQFFTPAVVEPYPLFLADRMVKSLGAGVAVVEQTVAQHVADEGADVELTILCLQNYRTEGGRGGV